MQLYQKKLDLSQTGLKQDTVCVCVCVSWDGGNACVTHVSPCVLDFSSVSVWAQEEALALFEIKTFCLVSMGGPVLPVKVHFCSKQSKRPNSVAKFSIYTIVQETGAVSI